ncbi:MAG: thymidine kinase [Brachymonas sp.]|nr:thymidine kinase [Brachymonas sp.]NJS36704.1 thymidine kinase [Brachymonas sp.]
MAKLYFRYAAMNAGKSTALLQAAFNYEERGMQVALLTAELDNRDGKGNIASRLGLTREATTFNAEQRITERIAATQLQHRIAKLACVLIDEAQFLTLQQVEELHRWAHEHRTPVMCYGIRSDFQGKAFPGSAALLTLADDVEEMKTICDCGKKASMNARFDDEGNRILEGSQVLIGGNTRYRALCPDCFYQTA